MSDNPLIRTGPRICDLHGDERIAALRARHDSHTAEWLRNRERRSIGARIRDWILG